MQIFNPPKIITYRELGDMKPEGLVAVVIIDYGHRGVPEESSNLALYGLFDQSKDEEVAKCLEVHKRVKGSCYLNTEVD